MPEKFYTGVGSRQAEGAFTDIMEEIGYQLALRGYTLRSGAAVGSDKAFERGCDRCGGQSVVSLYISANGGAGGANATKPGPISFNGGAGGGAGSGSTKSGYPGGSGGNGQDRLDLGYESSPTVRGAAGSGGSSSFGGRGQGGSGGGYNLSPAAGGSGFVQIEFFNPNGVIIRSDWDVLQSALLRQGIQVT